MRKKEKQKIQRFVEVADESALAMVAMVRPASGEVVVEAQGNDDSIGECYVTIYKMVKTLLERGEITINE